MPKGRMDSRCRGNDEDDDENARPPRWMTPFLTGLIVTGSVRTALGEAGIELETAWALREEEPEFAMYWERALRVHKGVMAGLAMLDAAESEEARVH